MEVKDGMSYITPEFKAELKAEMDLVFEPIVKKSGKTYNNKSSLANEIVNNTGFIDKLLLTVDKYNKIVTSCFCNHSDVKAAHNSALGTALNIEIPGVIIETIKK